MVLLRRLRVELYAGDRHDLRPLFELAEDSREQLDSYLNAGRVLVATVPGLGIAGHLQVVDVDHGRTFELKNMAVREDLRGSGVGRRLVESVLELLSDESAESLLVATAAADTGNLRFYQRLGFRMRSIERDAFTAATGYPVPILVDGIPLRDRVWLDRAIGS